MSAVYLYDDAHARTFEPFALTRPIGELLDERTAAIYELGLHTLQLSPRGGALPEKERRFEAGLLDLRTRHGLYSEYPRGVEITGDAGGTLTSMTPGRLGSSNRSV